MRQKREAILSTLEPQALKTHGVDSFDASVQVSIARSLKRIADALDPESNESVSANMIEATAGIREELVSLQISIEGARSQQDPRWLWQIKKWLGFYGT